MVGGGLCLAGSGGLPWRSSTKGCSRRLPKLRARSRVYQDAVLTDTRMMCSGGQCGEEPQQQLATFGRTAVLPTLHFSNLLDTERLRVIPTRDGTQNNRIGRKSPLVLRSVPRFSSFLVIARSHRGWQSLSPARPRLSAGTRGSYFCTSDEQCTKVSPLVKGAPTPKRLT